MARNEDESSPARSITKRLVNKRIAEMWEAAGAVEDYSIKSGNVPEELRRQLHQRVVRVVFVLTPARNEDEVNWEDATPFDNGPDELLHGVFDSKPQAILPSGEHNPEPEVRNAPARIDAATLHQCAIDLTELAYRLGVAYETDPQRTTVEPDPL